MGRRVTTYRTIEVAHTVELDSYEGLTPEQILELERELDPADAVQVADRILHSDADGYVMNSSVRVEIETVEGEPYSVQFIRDAEVGRVWECHLVAGKGVEICGPADGPMREAVERAFHELAGVDCEAAFTGWGGALNRIQREIVLEDRARGEEEGR